MNKCFLVGNLTRDPELSTVGNGISVCKFSIAINRTFANANGEKEVDYLNIVTWRGQAENCGKYLTKGSKVAVCGNIQTRTYEVDGQKRYATDIVADEVEFLSSRSGDNADEGQKKQTTELKSTNNEDLPF